MLLYQSDVNAIGVGESIERWRSYRGEAESYAIRLARGVERELEDLDALLSEVSVGWPVPRMNAVDRTVLRIGLYEMEHVEDVPPEVAMAEAAELVTGFSGEEAPSFVSGVLRGAAARLNLPLERVSHG